MVSQLRTFLGSILQLAFALYLGYGFSAVFLNAFVPASWTVPGVLLSGVGFFLLLRWLGQTGAETENASHRAVKPQRIKLGLFAPDQRHVFRVRKPKAAGSRIAGQGAVSAQCIKSPMA